MTSSKGTLWGVGVGPGDPELMTLKAKRVIEEAPVIAAPVTRGGATVALDIARQVCDISSKKIVEVRFSMSKDAATREAEHEQVVDALCAELSADRDVALLQLGDASIFATYQRIAPAVRERGFKAHAVAGVPSFCAIAAVLDRDLTPQMSSPLHIVPAGYGELGDVLALPGGKVIMKAGRSLAQTKTALREAGLLERAALVSNCGLPGEQVFTSLADAPDEGTSYFSTIVV